MADGPHGMEPAFTWDGHYIHRTNPTSKSKLFLAGARFFYHSSHNHPSCTRLPVTIADF